MGSVKVVKASAGSGKTYRLSYEYVKKVIVNPELYRHILAVTFTNKAADEMKRRIIREINDLANGRRNDGAPPAFAASLREELGLSPEVITERAVKVRTLILHDYSRFHILTIDKFFQRIIRAFIRELGGDMNYTIELQTDSVLDSAADKLIEGTLSDSDLRNWITGLVEEQIAEGKKWDIKRDITKLGGEIFKEQYKTGEGSVKTREEILSVVSSSLARVYGIKGTMKQLADEAVAIINDNGLSPEDFYYGKAGFVSFFYKVASGDVESGYGTRVKDALASDDKWAAAKSAQKNDVLGVVSKLRPILSRLCAIYDENIGFIHTVNLLRDNFRTYAILSDLSAHVADICRERGIVLIQQTNNIIGKLIEGNDAPFIFEKVGNNFSHFMMDEFQDTSRSQWDNFYPLLSNAVSQSEESPVLIVGDVKQSIYRWRGGDWDILGSKVDAGFREVEQFTLDKNYRSDRRIIEFNNNLIDSAVALDDQFLREKLADAQSRGVIDKTQADSLGIMVKDAYSDLRQSPGKETGKESGYVRIVNYKKNKGEDADSALNAHIIKLVAELQDRGYGAGDIAILVRSNTEGARIANMLLEYKSSGEDAEHSYDVVTREALILANSPVIKFVTACFKLAVGADVSINRGIFKRYLGQAVEDAMGYEEEEFISSLKDVSLEEAFEMIVMRYSLGDITGNVAYLQAYHDRLLSFANSKISDIPLFLKWWDENKAKESVELPDGRDAITVITIHKSKGLQYPVVIMPYVSWDVAPDYKTVMWTDTDKEPFNTVGKIPVRFKNSVAGSYYAPYYYKELVYSHIDNINLLYVAVTRAENELFMFVPEGNKKGDIATVGDLVTLGLRRDGDMAILNGMTGTAKDDGHGADVYEFGIATPHIAINESDEDVIRDTGYPVYKFEGKLRLNRVNERYAGEDGQTVISPRYYGRIMHRVFESISTAEQVPEKLDELKKEGVISAGDYEKVFGMITNALADPLIKSWFDGSWKSIRNENDIIIPSAGMFATRRPDRVLIRDSETVVIDYKFGGKENSYYGKQVAGYMKLLEEMGYGSISGYIWYVELGKVVKVGA